jgi:glycosyltransferase involved in cell wall biosynthesis
MARIGVVAIGRNEGERLRKCLLSLDPKSLPIVYVDSGSTDGSPAMAVSLGVTVVALDLAVPFTAARARNAGFERLTEICPDLEYVQFIDGDCEVAPGWLETATRFLAENPKSAVACGRRRERHLEQSIFNRLCDIEWDTPIGEAAACGGDALMRAAAFKNAGGFNPSLIAGEEPELCVRLRRFGGTIHRLDAEMTIHDAAMTRFGQWWKRSVRCGFAYSLGAHLHGRPPERHYVRERRRLLVWGFLIPATLLAAAWPTNGWSLIGFAVYPLQMARIAWRARRRPLRDAVAFGISCVASKLPEFVGWCKFQLSRRRGGPVKIIEYK